MPNIAGKVALITGSSSGIGASTAIYFASLGCNVSITGRSKEKLEKTKAQCIKAGLKPDQVLCTVADISKSDALQSLVDGTVNKFGKMDILVNNAGICPKNITINDPIENYDETMNTNLRSVIILTKLCIEHLIKTKGSMVNVSSINSTMADTMYTYYCISKAGLDQFTKCLALELAPKGVRVNCVNPAIIRTPMYDICDYKEENFEQVADEVCRTYPLGRIGEPEEVAKTIGFLASDDASFTTGQIFAIDGGIVTGMKANEQVKK